MKSKAVRVFFPSVILFVCCINCHAARASHHAKRISCGGPEDCILVDTSRHFLWLCQDGRPVKKFRVSLGRGGTDKMERGDCKTPLGEFSLGAPRPSTRFVIFIPIGYPTDEQRAKGYSGSDVGVHGPSSIFRRFENIRNDWTLGCIAVGRGYEISEIARWVEDHRGSKIIIK